MTISWRAAAAAFAFTALAAACGDSSTPSAAPGTAAPTSAGPAASATTAAATTLAESTSAPASPALDADGCITTFDPSVDYFTAKATATVATNFTIEYHNSYKVLTVKQPAPGAGAERYVLVQCGAPAPQDSSLAGAPVITIPVHKVFVSSTDTLPLITDIGHLDAITGVTQKDFIVNADVQAAIAAGKIVAFAPDGATVNTEQVIAAHPDVLFTGGYDDPSYKVLRDAKLAIVGNGSWLEADPLGRAEWGKFVAAFFDEEAKATATFDGIAGRYRDLAAKVAALNARPTVMNGYVYNGTWQASGGDGYAARLMTDAGADYVWKDKAAASGLSIDFEDMLARGKNADFWIDPGFGWTTLAAAKGLDARYAEFSAFQKGQVYNNDGIQGPGGGIDFYERGVNEPDVVLADLVKIFHPGLVPDHTFVFYRQVPAG